MPVGQNTGTHRMIRQFIGAGLQSALVTPTQVALTDSSGGVAATTIAAITNANNAGSADVLPTSAAIAQLAVTVAEVKVDIAAIISALQTTYLMATA